MDFIDDIKTEELYTSPLHRSDVISRTQSTEIGSIELFIGDVDEYGDDEAIYSAELSKSENRINSSNNLSWDDINDLEDIF